MLAMLATPAMLGCGELESAAAFEEAEVHVEIQRDEDARATGRLIGWNIGRGTLYAPLTDPLHPQWRLPEIENALTLLHEIGTGTDAPPLVRFSGLQIDGALGNDGYHFWDFADPDHVADPADNMAAFEYMAIVDEIGAEPLVTLNFGSGTAAEAAKYVDHLVGTGTSPEAAARAHWGRVAPYDVHTYEIGNEVYGAWNTGFSSSGAFSYANPNAENGGDPPWHGRAAGDPSAYAARGLDYIREVSAIDPAARFWVPLSQASMDAWGGPSQALPALIPLLVDPRVEAVVIHHYQVDDLSLLGFPKKDAPETIVAGSALFAPLYGELRALLQAVPRSAALQIVVTEYHAAGAFTFGEFDGLANTPIVGLGVADALLFFSEIGAAASLQHMALAFDGASQSEQLFEPWYNPFRVSSTGEVLANPSYVATKLIADHLAAQTFTTVTTAPLLNYTAGANTFGYDAVRAAAFGDEETTTLVLLNRDLDLEYRATFDIDEERWAIESATVYAPDAWDEEIGDSPIELAELGITQQNGRFRLTLPKHSLAGIRLSRR